jgi:hypothetical protein
MVIVPTRERARLPAIVLALALATVASACASGNTSTAGDAGGGSSDASVDADSGLDASSPPEGGVDAAVGDGAPAPPHDASVEGAAADGCATAAETCNLADDDCNGACDDILGCRIGVDRSYDATAGLHFYSTTDSESECCGYSVEQHDAFYLYAAQQTGLAAFYRCRTSTGSHLYTTDPGCEGQTSEGVMGWIGTSATCGGVPLYRLDDATTGDHLYTTSSAEAASAQSGGYTLHASPGYVWPADCGGTSCTWPSPIALTGSTLTAATGFPTAWYGFPIPGTQSFASLSGSVSVDNSANIYSEVLFILQYLPSGNCTSGLWPSSTPEYGPPGAIGLGQFIVKAPTQGTFTVPVDFTLPGGLPMTSCVLLGLNGGTVAASHDVTATASLSMTYTAPQTPAQSLLGAGGEFCFGQGFGCQANTTNDALSFANVTPITSAMHLVALYGDISDSTFDGTSSFGPLPAGAWTATNDFYVYHGSTECSSFGVASGIAGPGNYTASIPTDATLLLHVPLSGSGIGVSEEQVFQPFSGMPLAAGDCLVTLWGLQGGGAFDNETQVTALVGP